MVASIVLKKTLPQKERSTSNRSSYTGLGYKLRCHLNCPTCHFIVLKLVFFPGKSIKFSSHGKPEEFDSSRNSSTSPCSTAPWLSSAKKKDGCYRHGSQDSTSPALAKHARLVRGGCGKTNENKQTKNNK